MRVLLTNDDGVRAPGIEAMHDALLGRNPHEPTALAADLLTCAPLTVQSATSHGVTFNQPLMTTQERVSETMRAVAVDGRPADCVKLAVASIWPERFGPGDKPDLVVSGINAGANVGINVIYSGTVAAALEAAFLGVPAIAVSLHMGDKPPDFAIAAARALRAVRTILEAAGGRLEPGECLNVNIPLTHEGVASPREQPPLRVCPMNTHSLIDAYEKRLSPSGEAYYWPTGHGLDFQGADAGSDVDALFQGAVTVTPLFHDLTDDARLARWRSLLG